MSLASPPPQNRTSRVSLATAFSAILVGSAVLTLLFYAYSVFRPEAPNKAAPSTSASAVPASATAEAKPVKRAEKAKTFPNLEAVKAAAESGDAEAQFQLGYRFKFGWAVPASDAEAAAWFKKAADQGHARGQHYLGLAYDEGKGVAKSKGTATKLFRQAAEQGHPESQYWLALRIGWTSGRTEKAKKTAIEWYRKAATSGHAGAQRQLAERYEKGEDVPKDADEAAKWKAAAEAQARIDFEQSKTAAEQGDPWEQGLVAGALLRGEGVSKDTAEGIKFLKMAAENWGEPRFLIMVGDMFLKGENVAKDQEEGAKWIRIGMERTRLAAENGIAEFQDFLGAIYSQGFPGVVAKDKAEAIKWFKLAAENGSASAAHYLWGLYEKGDGVESDLEQALKWKRKAVENGETFLVVNVGDEFIESSYGAKIDLAEAAKLIRVAADRGDEHAQYRLGKMYMKGEGVSKDEDEGIKWLRLAAENEASGAAIDLIRALARSGKFLTNDEREEEALKLYLQIEDVSPVQAPYFIGKMLSDEIPGDAAAAARWWEMGAKLGDPLAQYSIGRCYENGEGVYQSTYEAEKWYRKSAEQGNAAAQHQLAWLYASGKRLTKNYVEAMKWFRRAAEKGHFQSQHAIGQMYAVGAGVPKDEIEGLAWYNVAAASGDGIAVASRDALEKRLGRELTLVAQQRSKEIRREMAARGRDSNPGADPKAPSAPEQPKASGSGAIVSNNGYVLTAAHVVGGANSVKVQTKQGLKNATLIRIDEANDLAVLKIQSGRYEPLAISPSRTVRLGQSVATIGFPNIDIQGFSPKVTKGEVSSLNGIGDDPRSWQVSVPVQPGNSGGPLLDEYGNLIGVVVSKLGMKAAKATGDIPQNVNYAVKSAYAVALVDQYLGSSAPTPKTDKLKFEDMVAKAQQAVVLILVY